ncbi:pyrroline-5-carboxylate reductase [uncultured Winogradskyella sp.]|uniref:pyrroline-5-carboxylate reductase n=1 Tax=uncultured Winogradskyella sp. TaxID=395353 RepID=UPI0026221E80|nr:pyrroline-5-carboxylate reductase [uncultured Winogradskyella sp.]
MAKKIAIIGGGNLGKSIADGLLSNDFEPSHLTITRNRIELLKDYSDKNVVITQNNKKAVQSSDIIIIAVKPYKIEDILKDIASEITSDKILVSVVSDFSIQRIADHFDVQPPILRAMPNTAASVNESITCIASENASDNDIKEVTSIFDALGEVILIDEHLMDAATVLGACGIAYVLRFIRAMIQGGIEIGFDAKTATKIATQTVKGASELLLKGGNHPEAEIDKVTTPKGCTITGLNEMEHNGFSSALIKGIKTSLDKIS